ncbi:MAG: hypothetical protein ACOYB4_12205, partial [Methyloceanibacter sp.]
MLEVMPVVRLHDPALWIGEVVWVARFGRGRGRGRRLAANFFAMLFFRGPGGQLRFVLGQLGGIAGLGAGFDLDAGLGQRGLAFLAAGDFPGDRQPVLQRRGVGLLGLGQPLRHFQFELGDHLTGPLVADGAVFAGVGQYLGAVGGDGELADLEQFELLGQWQHLDEALGEEGLVLAAEG